MEINFNTKVHTDDLVCEICEFRALVRDQIAEEGEALEIEVVGDYYKGSSSSDYLSPPDPSVIEDFKVYYNNVDITDVLEIDVIDDLTEQAFDHVPSRDDLY